MADTCETTSLAVDRRTTPIATNNLGPTFTLYQVTKQVTNRYDDVTVAHVTRMGQYAKVIADQLGLNHEMQTRLCYSSPLHDIGKLLIPGRILQKSGGFTPEESEIMKTHTVLGERILHNYKSAYLMMAAEIALCHHERWDGSGYPHGLSGESIPLSARIVAICDVYDALRSPRPYKAPLPHQTTVATMREGDGWILPQHFDPDVLKAFFASSHRFEQIYSGQLGV